MYFTEPTRDILSAIQHMSQAEIDTLKSAINSTAPTAIFDAAKESRRPNHCYIICPQCGNGSGRDATPIECELKDGVWLSYCHRCGEIGGDNLKVIAQLENLNLYLQEDFLKALAIGAEAIGYSIDNVPRRRSRAVPPPTKKPEPTREQIEYDEKLNAMILADIAEAQKHLHEMPESARRGIELETYRQFSCGWLERWQHPKCRLDGTKSKPSRRVIIPSGTAPHYNAIMPQADRNEENRSYWKMHAGSKTFLLAEHESSPVVLIVEGEIDALSIWQSSDYASVATLGAASFRPMLTAIDCGEIARDRQFITLFDADNTGKKNSDNLRGELVKRGIRVARKFLRDFLSDEEREKFGEKVDANDLLLEYGAARLCEILTAIVDAAMSDEEPELLEGEIPVSFTDSSAQPIEESRDDDLTESLFRNPNDVSDLAFARRLERFVDGSVKYLSDKERWLTYDVGIWQDAGEKNSAIGVYALQLADVLDYHARANEKRLASEFKKSKKIGAAITLLKSCESIRITAEDLDNHSELLCCLNGVVNLQTGELMPFDKTKLLTQQVQAAYIPTAQSPLVEKFFRDVFPNDDTRRFLTRWLGYCMTGDVREEKFIQWQGAGQNGKGVLGTTLLHLLADYAATIPPESLSISGRNPNADSATTSLNMLENRRFVLSEELPQNLKFDSALIKRLSGGDPFPMRRLYEKFRQVAPTWHLNFCGNFRAGLENVRDKGILRRILNIDFKQTFGTELHPADSQLKKKLRQPENLSALLAMLVREAVAWYRDGLLQPSAEMIQATREQIAENDFISEFIGENYEFDAESFVLAKEFVAELRNAYRAECSRFRDAQLRQEVAKVKGITLEKNRKNANIFRGIRKCKDNSDNDGGNFSYDGLISSRDYCPPDM